MPCMLLQKPLKFLLRLVAGVFTIREIAEFLEIALEAHAEHEHIAPSWLGGCVWRSSSAKWVVACHLHVCSFLQGFLSWHISLGVLPYW